MLIGRWYYAWALFVISAVVGGLLGSDVRTAKEEVRQQAYSQHQDYLRDKFHSACIDAGVEPPIVELALDTDRGRDRGYSLKRRNIKEEGSGSVEFIESNVRFKSGFVCAAPGVLDKLEDALSSEKNRETICSWEIKDNFYSITKPIVPGSRYTTTESVKGMSSLGVECEYLDSRILRRFYEGKFTSGS